MNPLDSVLIIPGVRQPERQAPPERRSDSAVSLFAPIAGWGTIGGMGTHSIRLAIIGVVSAIVGGLLPPSDPVSNRIASLAIFLLALGAYFLGFKNGKSTANIPA